jgi:hypothetical protein
MDNTLWFFFRFNGFPDGVGQVVNCAAVNTCNIRQRMESLRRTAHTQHPTLDKRGRRAGVVRQQLLDGHFRINIYHDRMITSFMTQIFALAQGCEKKEEGVRYKKTAKSQGCSENSTRECGSQTIICSRLDLIQLFFSQALRMRLTV